MEINKPFSEVIQSSLQSFVAQSWQWDTFPYFGSLVQTIQGSRTIFGLVYEVSTGSMDPVRHPFPYQKTEEELLAEQPQIFEFLQTTFSCLTIGYEEKGHIYYLRSPQPPKIHAFVSYVETLKRKQFLANHEYQHLLFGPANLISNLDELLLALLHQQHSLKTLTQENIHSFMHTYSLLSGNDYRRIKLFLQNVCSQ